MAKKEAVAFKQQLANDMSTDYKDFIIGFIAFEKDIPLTNETYDALSTIYNKWLDSDYNLLNDCFSDPEYGLFSYSEYKLLKAERN